MNNKYYVTNAIPYVNANPHIGHALEFVQSDVIARYHKLLGEEVCLLCGSDENALKNLQAAELEGEPVQRFVDRNANRFQQLAQELQVEFDIFQKGSDRKHHFPASQKLWQLCEKNGDIYKKEYEGLYCVGCEMFYTQSELNENGECFEHPGKKLEKVKEKNYFFRLSKYKDKIIELVTSDKLKIYPLSRKNEVLSFLNGEVHDISVSRSNERAKNWGVPVPGDDTQRMYVWFDALNIYQSGIGFGWDEKKYHTWWPADVHAIGKGIIRFHAVYWPAFLLSAGLDLPKSLFVHGYITVDGQKMSKTVGNVVDPFNLILKWGSDALRYYLLREVPPFDDGDYSESRMEDIYNSELANELGNLVIRISTIAEKDELAFTHSYKSRHEFAEEFVKYMEAFEFHRALEWISNLIKTENRNIDEFAPWKHLKDERKDFLKDTLERISHIAYHLQPFLPTASKKILTSLEGPIRKMPVLFPKL